ncbi:MAG TPA: bifunctional diaminohydroxyphosphoribosylaminopyrimidine deaminase/5-amino-6-(5-phosphoribosylamino)uracil reductase RibD [Candidatus Saccharimonadales bacterium]|nr:bifunctional diaminohydroxyphosphoribosylaminopyrimidine deaminase/5-amino-6-(5-phosphoribosylamino)uracil reductase RibD [Candidatus Saccharimonadales bacterium]
MKLAKSNAQTSRPSDLDFMRRALRLARRGFGRTSPNPMVGAVLVRDGAVIGQGWHRRAGQPHAEIEALSNSGNKARGATLFVTLEPCCTHGRTPPCTDAIIAAGVRRVVAAARDPNPAHSGKGLEILERAGIAVGTGLLSEEAAELNEAFNHWIVNRTPFVTIKAAMSLDGKIAASNGQSKWITREKARAWGMRLRAGADAILVGVNTIARDNPSLTARLASFNDKPLRRIILDPRARSPLEAKVYSDAHAPLTTLVVTQAAPKRRVKAFSAHVRVLEAPERNGLIDLRWLARKLGHEDVTSLLVEGGGETNASFLAAGLAHRIAFFYAPMVLGGHGAPKAVGGKGVSRLSNGITLCEAAWRRLGPDLLLTARVNKTAHYY